MTKLEKLKAILAGMDSVLVAYSGGADSTFLVKVASLSVAGKVIAVTAVSATYPKKELSAAAGNARRIGVRHVVIKTSEVSKRAFSANTTERCFVCKSELFSKLRRMAEGRGTGFVLDASTVSDEKDFRPGNRAKKRFGIRSPLAEAGLTKDDIRRYSRKMGLATWDKPSAACLASRIPYGTKITPALLRRVDQAERFFRHLGCGQVRVRDYTTLARIEVSGSDLARIVENRTRVVTRLKALGYHYVTVDLEGYRTGSMNEVVKKEVRQ